MIEDGFQLWVNLPSSLKMATRVTGKSRPLKFQSLDWMGVMIEVIAGEVERVKGGVKEIFADPGYLDVSIPPEKSYQQPVKHGHTAFAYVFEGKVLEVTKKITPQASNHLIIFGEGDMVKAPTVNGPLRFLLISGKPLNEPIARYGPVMNTDEEIVEALKDLREGTFVK
ncbi:hypothetical protein DSECCO2_57510 [anaerobic digester metagenome]